MDIPLFEVPASDFRYIVDGDESVAVDFVDDFLHLAVFEPVDDAGDFLVFFICISAFDDIIGGVSAEPVVDGLDEELRLFRNDLIRFGAAESFFDQVDHFGCDEVRDTRQERALQAKDERHDDEDEDVQEQDHVTRPERHFARQQHGKHVDAVERTAVPERKAHAESDDDPANYGDEQGVAFDDGRNMVHECRRISEGRDADNGVDGEASADLLIAEVDERDVEDGNQQAERQAEQLGADDAEARDAAVRYVVRNQHGFEAVGGDERSDDDGQRPLENFGFVQFSVCVCCTHSIYSFLDGLRGDFFTLTFKYTFLSAFLVGRGLIE